MTSNGTSLQFAAHPRNDRGRDTSPLRYPILIDEVNVLPKLFSKVVVPAAVIGELLNEDARDAVRDWAANLPPWVIVRENPIRGTAGLEKLQAGEQAAILLAEPISAELILLGENWRAALPPNAACGLRVRSVPLVKPRHGGWLTFLLPLTDSGETNFRCSPALMKAILDRFAAP